MISVIVPVYNRKDCLERCLDSLANQTFNKFECILCDDGSTENFDDLILKYSTLIDLKYFKIKNSGGPAKPRNIGIKNSKFDFISFLDSDDSWFPNRLELCMKYLKEGVEFLHHESILIDDKKKIKSSGYGLKPNYVDDLLLKGNPIITSNVIINKSVLKSSLGFDENSIYHSIEDFDLWIKIFLNNKKIKYFYLNQTLGNYFIDKNSISKIKLSKHIRRHFVLYKRYKHLFKERINKYIFALLKTSFMISYNNQNKVLVFFYFKKILARPVFNFDFLKVFFRFLISRFR